MGDFLKLASGEITEANAKASSAGAGDANQLVKLNGSGKIDETMLPAGIAPESRSVEASENLSAGDFVNFHNSSGLKMRKADADAGREAHAFVLAAVTSGQSGTAYPEENVVTGLSGMTPGLPQYLSNTAGGRTETAPTGAGVLSQRVGFALSATEMLFRPERPIVQVA